MSPIMPVELSVLLASLLATLLGSTTVAAQPPATTELQSHAPKLERGYLRVQGVDRTRLVEALALRVPHLPLVAFDAATGIDSDVTVAFIDVQPASLEPGSEPRKLLLTIVISDGRAFDRRVETGDDDEETIRLLASTAANLLLAVEAGTVVADRGDVPIPSAAGSVCPPCERPLPPSCPPATEIVGPKTVAEPVQAATPAPRFELGPVVAAMTTLGLGAPAQADRYAAAGAQLGLHGRLPRGAFFGVELRAMGRGEVVGTSMARLRTAFGAGYELRRGAWALGASLWGTVEPWWIRGAPVDPPPRPLWGLAVRLTPSFHRSGLAGGTTALAVGPLLELAASASLSERGAEVGLVVVREQGVERSRLRVGGVELSMGLGATVWFGLPR